MEIQNNSFFFQIQNIYSKKIFTFDFKEETTRYRNILFIQEKLTLG